MPNDKNAAVNTGGGAAGEGKSGKRRKTADDVATQALNYVFEKDADFHVK